MVISDNLFWHKVIGPESFKISELTVRVFHKQTSYQAKMKDLHSVKVFGFESIYGLVLVGLSYILMINNPGVYF